jgi:hypothetical protein
MSLLTPLKSLSPHASGVPLGRVKCKVQFIPIPLHDTKIQRRLKYRSTKGTGKVEFGSHLLFPSSTWLDPACTT